MSLPLLVVTYVCQPFIIRTGPCGPEPTSVLVVVYGICSCLVKMMTWWYQNVNNHCAKSLCEWNLLSFELYVLYFKEMNKTHQCIEKYKTSYHIAWLHSHSVNDDQPSTSSSKASSMGWTKTISFFLHFLFTALFSHLVHPLKKSPKQKWECGKYFSNSICSDSINHTSIITSNTKRNLPFFYYLQS